MKAISFLSVVFAVGLLMAQSNAPQPSTATPADSQPALNSKQIRHDPAYRQGYERGYQQGANDSAANSSGYNDQAGPVYEAGDEGFSVQYGERGRYQKIFRLGYVAGYKEGWDYNAGRYCATCNR